MRERFRFSDASVNGTMDVLITASSCILTDYKNTSILYDVTNYPVHTKKQILFSLSFPFFSFFLFFFLFFLFSLSFFFFFLFFLSFFFLSFFAFFLSFKFFLSLSFFLSSFQLLLFHASRDYTHVWYTYTIMIFFFQQAYTFFVPKQKRAKPSCPMLVINKALSAPYSEQRTQDVIIDFATDEASVLMSKVTAGL